MAAQVHSRSECALCLAELVFLAGDPTVGYEDILPLEGEPRTLVEHTAQRCDFHRFLTPDPARHVLPGNADWTDQSLTKSQARLRSLRWVRTDPAAD